MALRWGPGHLTLIFGLLVSLSGCGEGQPTVPPISTFAWIEQRADQEGVAAVRGACRQDMEKAFQSFTEPASLQDAYRATHHVMQAIGTAEEWVRVECRAAREQGKPGVEFEAEVWNPLLNVLERSRFRIDQAAASVAAYREDLLQQPESERVEDKQYALIAGTVQGTQQLVDDSLFWMARLALLAERHDLLAALFDKFGPMRTWTHTPKEWVPTVVETADEFRATQHDWERLLRRRH